MTTKNKRTQGRPVGYRKENPFNMPVQFMATEDQRELYSEAAAAVDMKRAEWIRDTLDRAAESLSIRANQLYDSKAKIVAAKQDDERAELKRLRKENKTLRIEKKMKQNIKSLRKI